MIIAEQTYIPGTEPVVQPQKEYRAVSLLNKAEVRRRILRLARDTKSHRFTRVSSVTMNELEARLEAAIRSHVQAAPSRGKTL